MYPQRLFFEPVRKGVQRTSARYYLRFKRGNDLLRFQRSICQLFLDIVDALDVYKKYESYQSLDKNDIKILRDYACRQFHNWTPNADFYQAVHEECNNLYLVIKWGKRHKLSASALKGENVGDDVIVFRKNFFFFR